MNQRPSRPSVVLCLVLLALAGCRSDGPRIDRDQQLAMHREFALSYYDEGDLLRAEDQVDRALELEPKDQQLLLMKGWIRQRRGTPEDVFVAESVFRDLAPKQDYRALLGLAQALERKGVLFIESAEAVAAGRRETASADPVERAAELRDQASAAWRESVQWYERTLEEKPGELQAVNGLQRVHGLQGNLEESLSWSERLLEQSKAEVDFWQAQLKRPELSASEERRLRDLQQTSRELQVETHLQASTLLEKLGRPAQALAHVDEALLSEPDHPGTHARRAQLLHQLGRHADAVASLETYLRLSDEAFDHPDVARALDLLTTWRAEAELERAP